MRRIVVGYDGSDSARRALERAAALADEDTRITVVSAVHGVYSKVGVTFDPVEEEDHARHLREALARLTELGVDARTVEGKGDPAELIVNQAEQEGADLIVVGSEGKNLIERLLLGSVSSGVVDRARTDVLVVH
jgi:nucleotide-binding universal stress UspA family protein